MSSEEFVIDVLHQLNGKPVDADMIASAEELDVLAIRMRVLPPTQVVTEKLNSLNEHHCDFAALLPAIRAVRERVDWDRRARGHRRKRLRGRVSGAHRPVGHHRLDNR